jgi:hypothetical protein
MYMENYLVSLYENNIQCLLKEIIELHISYAMVNLTRTWFNMVRINIVKWFVICKD